MLYALGWSNIYPKLEISLIVFFLISFLIALIFGLLVDKSRAIGYQKLSGIGGNKLVNFLAFIWIGHSIQFIYFEEIPLISLITGANGVDYKQFGIKVFHVILVSFNSFVIVYLFHHYISTNKKRVFYYYLLSILPALLIVNRGMFIIAILSSFFVFLMSRKRFLTIKQLSFTLIMVLVLLYFFGMLGNIRSGHGDPTYIPMESKATKSFMKSSIPKEYYWTYLYGASPLANFQYNINNTKKVNYNLFDMALFEMTPKVLSKRIAFVLEREPLDAHKVRDWLTVGTIYSRSYSYAKWLGPIFLFIYTIFITLIIIVLIPKRSSYHVSVIAILSTIIFMNTFSNMLVFSGIVLQLVYPVFFSFFENKKIVLKRINDVARKKTKFENES